MKERGSRERRKRSCTRGATRRRGRERGSTRWTEKTEVARVCGRVLFTEQLAKWEKLRRLAPVSRGQRWFMLRTRAAAHRARYRGPESGRCLRVFLQPGYVYFARSPTTNNLDRVRKDYPLYRPQSESPRINRMFIHRKWPILLDYFSLTSRQNIVRYANDVRNRESVNCSLTIVAFSTKTYWTLNYEGKARNMFLNSY